MSRKEKTPQLTRKSWILAAENALISGGIGKVNVEGLARSLGVTKGSFYWHFKDRQQLLDELLNYWVEEMTDTVLEMAREFSGNPVKRIHMVAEYIVSHERARLDPYIRAWSLHDKVAEEKVKKTDKKRFDFLNVLFKDAGFKPLEAEARARLLYYYVLGEHLTTIIEPLAERLARLRIKTELLTGGL